MAYITSSSLKAAVLASQAAGTLTPELVALVAQLAEGYWARHGKTDEPWEDVLQDTYVNLLISLPRLKHEGNIFGYLTTIVANAHGQRRNKARKVARALHNYWENVKRDAS